MTPSTSSPTTAPYGAWASPLGAASLAGERVVLDQPSIDAGHVYWLEGRGTEGGRVVLVRDGVDLTPAPWNVRSRAHEYGGGAYTVAGGVVAFVDFTDQRVRVLQPDGPGPDQGEPRAITPESDGRLRWADLRLDLARRQLVCVREDHRGGGEAVSTVVRLDLDTDNADGGTVLVQGPDFVAAPRLSADGSRLAWLQWNHPNMPWDSTELWTASVTDDGTEGAHRVAGGEGVAVTEPRWTTDGALLHLSDETGWANLRAVQTDGRVTVLTDARHELGWPQWVFDRPSFGSASDGTIVCSWFEAGRGRLGTVAAAGALVPFDLDGVAWDHVRVEGRTVVALVDRVDRPRSVVTVDLDSGACNVVREESAVQLPDGMLSEPETVSWTNTAGQTVHGIYHPPANAGYRAPDGELPPLVVRLHGGPTSMTVPSFSLDTTYWTSRGLAVLDVNYGGSTGHGRAYRERLQGQWGVVDVDDCATGARAMADQGRADARRLAIRGGSAGGFTTLAALTGTDVFAVGASYFGLGDLEAFVRETHKFESRYLDGLVAPYPEGRDVYLQRSPLHHLEKLSAPMILLQGLDDRVVPPNQATAMADAVRAKGLPVAHLEFAGEGHGFRSANTIVRAREAEAYFYARIFGYELADTVEPVDIDNL
ncbi:prolyl oligopeptidase family serine peptidase [Pedococcus sp. KACC 23699]|uniref:Prolyl oligopeptidase family serine peptidase n=1 Tax=Pedococcus sp. KACC 23699 TaxID=3149228 RepID=A0AAU7JP49_9MICO